MGAREGVLVGLHILVVEDDVDARQILQMLLEHFGALTTVVTNAPEALRLLAHLARALPSVWANRAWHSFATPLL